ncbi:MAG: OmpA family protein [Bacteroidetes bacterium]|nr:OmpA family protein [Bacteroidota bacterium]
MKYKWFLSIVFAAMLNSISQSQNIIDTSTIDFNKPLTGEFFRTYPRQFLDSNKQYIADYYYDSIYDILSQLPDTCIIEIGAHTSSVGTLQRNLNVSQKRANLFGNYLVTICQFPQNRLVPKGYGESQLLNHCTDEVECTQEEQMKNVRMEFKIIEKKE